MNVHSTAYYRLINQQSIWALYIPSSFRDFEKEQINKLEEQNQKSLGQLWQIIKIQQKNVYEIVHFPSTLVLTKIKQNQVKLRKGNWDSSQLFQLQKVKGEKDNIFRIYSAQSNKQYLYFSTELKVGEIDPKNNQCKWHIKLVQKNQHMALTCSLQNAFSCYFADVPVNSQKTGTEIIQYRFNNRFNQRFRIFKQGDTYLIVSMSSRLFVTASSKVNQGDKITQEQQLQKQQIRQKWFIQYKGANLYVIKSAYKPQKMIGIKQSEATNQLARLISTENQQTTLWKINGFLPVQ